MRPDCGLRDMHHMPNRKSWSNNPVLARCRAGRKLSGSLTIKVKDEKQGYYAKTKIPFTASRSVRLDPPLEFGTPSSEQNAKSFIVLFNSVDNHKHWS